MKPEKKYLKVKKIKIKEIKNMEEEVKSEEVKIENLPDLSEITAASTAAEPIKVVIGSFSGDFGRADINLLRDKVNEIIDFLNK